MSAPQRRRAEGSKPSARITKAERRRQLLVSARRLFEARGYPNTSMALVAGDAAVPESLLAKYFADKKALFLAVLHEFRQATVDSWQDEAVGLTDPLAKLHAITDRYLQATRQFYPELRILQRTLVEADDEEILTGVRAYFLDWEAQVAHVIAEGQHAGVCRRSLDPRVGAWEIIHNVLGQTVTLPLGIPLHQDDYLPQAADCLLHCLLKTDV